MLRNIRELSGRSLSMHCPVRLAHLHIDTIKRSLQRSTMAEAQCVVSFDDNPVIGFRILHVGHPVPCLA